MIDRPARPEQSGVARKRRAAQFRRVAVWPSLVALLWACAPAAEAPLLILITVDTLRADQLGVYGNALDLTPNIDMLMEEGDLFSHAFSTCSYTLPSLSALMTGRYPEELGAIRNTSLLRPGSATLAEILRLNGWRSGAVVSNYVLRSGTGIERGFDFFDDTLPERESNRDVPERTATPTTDAALAMLDRLGEAQPGGVLLWIHYQDPHGPYLPPEGKREQTLEARRQHPDGRRRLDVGKRRGLGSIPDYQYQQGQHEVAFYRAGYDGEVSYLDDEIGRLMAGLEERGLRERAVIVLTADHGEGLGERDYWFSHGEYLTDPLVRVPLSIRVPGRSASRRGDPVSLVDLLPTLLELFEISAPTDYAGRDLLAEEAPQANAQIYLATLGGSPIPRFGLIQDRYKYLVSRQDGKFVEELYRLGYEERDLSASDGARVRDMRERLAVFRNRLMANVPEVRQSLSPDQRKRLRQLGYAVD